MKNLPALYAIANEYLEAADRLADLELPEQVVKDTLEGLAGELEAKSTNVAAFVKNLETSAEAIGTAIAAMTARQQALLARAERVKSYLKENMERTGITKIECPYFVLKIKKNPESVRIIDAGAIPDDYKRFPPIPEPAPDKTKIKEALKAGTAVPGCELKQDTHLEIK